MNMIHHLGATAGVRLLGSRCTWAILWRHCTWANYLGSTAQKPKSGSHRACAGTWMRGWSGIFGPACSWQQSSRGHLEVRVCESYCHLHVLLIPLRDCSTTLASGFFSWIDPTKSSESRLEIFGIRFKICGNLQKRTWIGRVWDRTD
jgi:hypothetical protein